MKRKVFRLVIEPEDEKLIRAVVKDVLKTAKQERVEMTSEELVERFIKTFEGGERDYTRLKALTLGAEIAPSGTHSRPAN